MMERFICVPLRTHPGQPASILVDVDSEAPYPASLQPLFGLLSGHTDVIAAVAKGLNMRPAAHELLQW